MTCDQRHSWKDAEAGILKTNKVWVSTGSLQGLVEMKFSIYSIYIPKHAWMGHKRSLISHTDRLTGPHRDRKDCIHNSGLKRESAG